jgi:hypothetical protein
MSPLNSVRKSQKSAIFLNHRYRRLMQEWEGLQRVRGRLLRYCERQGEYRHVVSKFLGVGARDANVEWQNYFSNTSALQVFLPRLQVIS